MTHKTLSFPKNFFWGAGTSAHQVEGGNTNQWSEWEKLHATDLAEQAAQKFPFLSKKLAQEAAKPQNYISGKACAHYERYSEDCDLMQSLGFNAYRFSLEWSRIEPTEGKFDQAALAHYRNVLNALRARKIEPFVTLWHWTLPLWFEARGGWAKKGAMAYFQRFVAKVVSEYSDLVHFWIPLNEPEVYTSSSYFLGKWPPQKKNLFLTLRVRATLIRAQHMAYNTIKKIAPLSQVGIAQALAFIEPYRKNWLNRLLAKYLHWQVNQYFLNRSKNTIDFVGVNYYFHTLVDYFGRKEESKKSSDLGWELHPEGIYPVLQSVKKYKKPIYITENGLADGDDSRRAGYLKAVLQNVARALHDGLDIRGYLHWALLDNFEWDKGFWPRFGLIAVDYQNDCQRSVRRSAEVYAQIIQNNFVESPW